MPDAHGAKIFISYRRDDAGAEAGRLSDDLQRAFGDDSVFLDVVGIQLGRDFRKAIHQNVGGCGVLLAVIGPQWATIKGPDGTNRLSNANDYVRLEIATALQRDIPVVPVLVRGATLPNPNDLPEDLQEMIYRNSVELTHTRWHSDSAMLITALKQLLEDLAAESNAKRQAAEQEREAEATRQRQIEAQRRLQEIEALFNQATAANQRPDGDLLKPNRSRETEAAIPSSANAALPVEKVEAAAKQQPEPLAKRSEESVAEETAQQNAARIDREQAHERAKAEAIHKQQAEREAARIEQTKQRLTRETEERVAARAVEKLAAERERQRSEEAYQKSLKAQRPAGPPEQRKSGSTPTFAAITPDAAEGLPTVLKILGAVLVVLTIAIVLIVAGSAN